jgi:hypothetical protein
MQADVRAIDPSNHEVHTALLHVRVPSTQRAYLEAVDIVADDLSSHRVEGQVDTPIGPRQSTRRVVLRQPVIPEHIAELCEPSVGLTSTDFVPSPRVAALPPT